MVEFLGGAVAVLRRAGMNQPMTKPAKVACTPDSTRRPTGNKATATYGQMRCTRRLDTITKAETPTGAKPEHRVVKWTV